MTGRTLSSALDACPPWSDDFPTSLVDFGCEIIPPPLTARTQYGTARLVLNRPDAVLDILDRIPVWTNGASTEIVVEYLHQEAQPGASLRFASRESILETDVLPILHETLEQYLNCYPGIAASIASLLWAVHILDPGSDDYDVSHSSPEMPFSAFLSVPQTRSPDACLRVIEALIHETMHLQLSLVERIIPLIDGDAPGPLVYSPWRQENRTAYGILHALYVFRVLQKVWSVVSQQSSDPFIRGFAQSRVVCIGDEVDQVRGFHEHPALTNAGQEFVRFLLQE